MFAFFCIRYAIEMIKINKSSEKLDYEWVTGTLFQHLDK